MIQLISQMAIYKKGTKKVILGNEVLRRGTEPGERMLRNSQTFSIMEKVLPKIEDGTMKKTEAEAALKTAQENELLAFKIITEAAMDNIDLLIEENSSKITNDDFLIIKSKKRKCAHRILRKGKLETHNKKKLKKKSN